MADITLINPRFEVSYRGMEHALPFLGKRADLHEPEAYFDRLDALYLMDALLRKGERDHATGWSGRRQAAKAR